MATKADVSIKLQGYTPANRDALVTLTSEATGKSVTTKPFLDGSLILRDLDPGIYEVDVRHPNLINPIDRRRIRIFPQPQPTQVSIHVPDVLFRDTPIRDVANADVTPVQSAAANVRSQAEILGNKSPGQAILASDWNRLTGAVADLAAAVGELTQLVSPRGHDHPEIAERIQEVQGNLRSFAEAFGRTVLEVRRQVEADELRRNTDEVLTLAGTDSVTKAEILERVKELQDGVLKDPTQYTQKLTTVGAQILTQINEIAVSKGAAGQEFLDDERVKKLTGRASTYTSSGVQTKPENELLVYQKSGSQARNAGRR